MEDYQKLLRRNLENTRYALQKLIFYIKILNQESELNLINFFTS